MKEPTMGAGGTSKMINLQALLILLENFSSGKDMCWKWLLLGKAIVPAKGTYKL